VNKQPGIVVHPTGIHLYDTLMNAVHAHYHGADYLPRIVHRLDRETSGVLVLAKHDAARTHLARQIEGRTVSKSYRALVHGVFARREGSIDSPLGTCRFSHIRLKQDVNDCDGLPSHTDYCIAASAPSVPGFVNGLSLVDLVISTGRTHQIRVHLAASGHPVLADKLYGRERACRLRGHEIEHHLLHAWKFGCIHPGTNAPVVFTAPLPNPFSACVSSIFGPLSHR
jgi:23S rRNA pseudouridine1911/1915/1917 synthase